MKKLKVMLSLTALLVTSSLLILASCKPQQGGGNAKTKNFNVEYIKVWTSQVKDGNVEVAGGSPKEVEVKVTNCKKLTAEVGGQRGTGTNSKVIVPNVNIMKGNSTLTLKLTAKGFEDETFDISVLRKDSKKPFSVAIVAAAGESPSPVLKGQMVETTLDQTEVVVTAKFAMTEVKINGNTATLAGEKEAKLSVAVGKVDVSVTFADYESDAFTFNIQKVNPTERSIACTNVKLTTEKYKDGITGLSFDGNRKLEWEANGDDIQYSYVEVEMEFDVDIKQKPEIACKSERSSSYSTAPKAEDFRGVFAGYVVKEVDEKGQEEVIESVKEKKYKQKFIVGAGTVEYELTFKANSRKDTKFKIIITNKNTSEFDATIANKQIVPPCVALFDALGAHGMYVNVSQNGQGPRAMHLPLYHKGPVYDDKTGGFVSSTSEFTNLSAIDGRLKFFLEATYPSANYDKEGGLYFYGATSSENGKCFEFTQYAASEPEDYQGNKIDSFAGDIDVNDKYFDGFAAFKTKLPKAIHPVYTGGKWTLKGKDPLAVTVGNINIANDGVSFGFNKGCSLACNYRVIMKYLSEVQTNNPSQSGKALNLYKKMEWKNPLFGDNTTTEKAGAVLEGVNDSLFIRTMGVPKNKIKKAVFTITKGDTEDNCDDPSSCNSNGKEVAIIELRNGSIMLIPGVVIDGDKRTFDKAFKFTEAKVYKVKLKVEYENNASYDYTYILDYGNNDSHKIEFDGLDGDSSSDLFGIPTSSPSFMMPELRCAALSRANVFAIK